MTAHLSTTRPWLAHYDAGVPHEVDIPEIPLHALLDLAAERCPKARALIFYDCEMTYEELKSQVDAFAAALRKNGLQKGERVMLLLPNIPQAVISFYGTLKAGGVAVLSDPLAAADDIAEKIRDCEPRFVVMVRPVLPAVLEARVPVEKMIMTRVRDYLPTLRGAFVALFDRKGSVAAARISNLVWMKDLLREGRGLLAAEKPSGKSRATPAPAESVTARIHGASGPDDLAVLAYTSGTILRPRAVMLTHRNLVANTMQVRLLYADAQDGREVVVAAIPFGHSYGLTCMNLGIALAGCLLLVPQFKSHDALNLISKYHPTLFPGVPAMYVSLVNHPLVKQHALGSIRACVSGASPLAVEVREAFERLTKGRLVEGYGLTEASPVTHANPLAGRGKPSKIGLPLPGTDARIVDASGQEVAPGQIGELEVRGPQVMAGYWHRDEDTAAALHEGWLRTGDLATMDADGFFQVICRRQDVIRVGEHEVYPRDVEEVLYEHPKVREAAVIGVLVEGQVVLRAHVALRFGERSNPSDIIEFCRKRLSPWKVPTLVKFERKLPRSPVGKVLRRLL